MENIEIKEVTKGNSYIKNDFVHNCHIICRCKTSKLSKKYITDLLDTADSFHIAIDRKCDSVVGIVIFENVNSKINVLLLCSNPLYPGLGTMLIFIPINIAESLKYTCNLNAIPNAVEFYLKK